MVPGSPDLSLDLVPWEADEWLCVHSALWCPGWKSPLTPSAGPGGRVWRGRGGRPQITQPSPLPPCLVTGRVRVQQVPGPGFHPKDRCSRLSHCVASLGPGMRKVCPASPAGCSAPLHRASQSEVSPFLTPRHTARLIPTSQPPGRPAALSPTSLQAWAPQSPPPASAFQAAESADQSLASPAADSPAAVPSRPGPSTGLGRQPAWPWRDSLPTPTGH